MMMKSLSFVLVWAAHSRRGSDSLSASLVQGKSASDSMDTIAKLADDVVFGRASIHESTREVLGAIHIHMQTVIASANTSYNTQQQILDQSLSNIEACEAVKSPHSGWNGDVTAKETTHGECRERQSTFKIDMARECGTFHSEAAFPIFPAGCQNAFNNDVAVNDIPGMMECLRKVKEWSQAYYPVLVGLKATCDNKTETHDAEVLVCNSAQTNYEGAFCSYHQQLTLSCLDYHDCWIRKNSSHFDTVELVKTEAISFQAEWSAAMHVICLLDVLNETDSETQKTKLVECKQLPTNNSELLIDYGTIPSYVPCDITPVSIVPCEASWLQSRYATKAWSTNAPPGLCTECAHLTTPPPPPYWPAAPLRWEKIDGKCPGYASSQNPDSEGDCSCQVGEYCSLLSGEDDNEERILNCPNSGATDASRGEGFFLPGCTNCMCLKACPSNSRDNWPDYDGECRCPGYCSVDGGTTVGCPTWTRTTPIFSVLDSRSNDWFSQACSDCRCYE